MGSLRSRTLWRVMLLLLAGTGLLALYNYHDSSHEIAEVYDAHLAQNARLLQGVMSLPLAGAERQTLYQAFNEALSQSGAGGPGHPYENKLAFAVWSEDGQLRVRSASAPGFDTPPKAPGFSTETRDGRQWRGFVLPVPAQKLVIWVGERYDVRDDLVGRIVRHTLMPFLAGSLALALLVWLAIGRGLEPLQNMARVIRGRHADSLEPLQLVPLPRELEPMQAALNRLLSQVESLLQREHRFIADAAHEMRTPLAVLRLHAQNAAQADNEQERDKALDFLIDGVDRLSRVVNQLLTLARLEPASNRSRWKALDVQALVTDSLAELTPWMLRQQVEPDLEIASGDYRTLSDRGALEVVLQNLVSNAVNFSPAGATVRVTLERQGGDLLLTVQDSGPGIEETRLDRAFERFYSDGNPNGAGLGLSIVSRAVQRLGGDVRLGNRPEGGLEARVRLPVQDQSPS
ncbi:ATP-binding protein [Pseudomonas sp. MT3]